MYDSNPQELYKYLLTQLDALKVGFIEVMNGNDCENYENYGYPASRVQFPDMDKTLRQYFKGTYVGNCGLTPKEANEKITNKEFDLVSFATLFISNPDLVEKYLFNVPFTPVDWSSVFYGPEGKGYTDYPSITVPAKDTLFQPFLLGDVQVKNKIGMASMTRNRC